MYFILQILTLYAIILYLISYKGDLSLKLNEINFINHPFLHNLHINLTNDNGEPYENIIFVGDNGIGKTSILKELSNYNESKYIQKTNSISSIFIPHDIKYHEILKYITNGIKGTWDMSYGTSTTSLSDLLGDTSDLDKTDEQHNNNSDEEIFKPYIRNVNINNFTINLDNEKIKTAIDKNVSINDLLSHALDISGISNSNNELKEKYIDNNSSGEQEIILRLKYIQFYLSKNTDLIIIDEPENSLHPKWQLKILDILLNTVLQNSINNKEKQFFIATHSENVLKSAFNRANTLILRLYRDKNETKVERISALDRVIPTVSFPEVQFLVFGIPTTDYHNQLYGELQNILNKNVKETDTYILSTNHFTQQLQRISNFNTTTYYTLPTYIRNATHHPNAQNNFNEAELTLSINILRNILKDFS